MRILLTNDDGYTAPGIRALYDVLAPLHDVIVAAPHSEQSGIGHAFTFHSALRYRPLPAQSNMPGHVIHGTPADCVKFSISMLLEKKPDLVVSGINKGENSGTSGFYSGTVAAAREGAFWRIPSIAFSICDEGFGHLQQWARKIPPLVEQIEALNRNGLSNDKNRTFFNVNFPGCDPALCKGLRVTRQSLAFFDDRYRKKMVEPVTGEAGLDHEYWIYGTKVELEESDLFDSRALLNNYITLTPLCFDATADQALNDLRTLEY